MALIIALSVSAVLGLFVPVFVVSLAPNMTIKLLESCRIYEPGRLSHSKQTYAADFNRTSVIYSYRMPQGGLRGENGRIAGWMLAGGLLLFLPLGAAVGFLIPS